jgi:hypothetical protein
MSCPGPAFLGTLTEMTPDDPGWGLRPHLAILGLGGVSPVVLAGNRIHLVAAVDQEQM